MSEDTLSTVVDTPAGPNAAEKLLLGQASEAEAAFVTVIHGELDQPGLPPIRTGPSLNADRNREQFGGDEDDVEGDGWSDSVGFDVEALLGPIGDRR